MDLERIAGAVRWRLSKLTKRFGPAKSGPFMASAHRLADAEFLHYFDLESVQNHLGRGDVAGARAALLDHFQNRSAASWPIPPRTLTDLRLEIDKMTPQALIRKADLLVDLRITPDEKKPQFDANENIAWDQNLSTSREWLLRLNRHAWWPVLALAYQHTGNEDYVVSFEKQLCHWIEVCRPPVTIDERSPHWRLMETALRMRVSWIPSFAIFMKAETFSPEARMMMLRSIYDHAKFLSLYKTGLNHLLREINGLACVSVYFPEFREANAWLDIALSRLEGEIGFQINADGSHVEVSTGYQWLALDELEAAFDLLKAHHATPLTGSLQTVLEKMYALLAHVIRPDWTFPEINDGFLRWKHDRLVQAAGKFKRNDFLFVGSGGERGSVPSQCSKAFEDAGWYVMRSDWSREARYLFFDAGPYGGNHGHEDKLSIEVYAFGQSFIVDCGSYTYEKKDPYRAYFVGSQGHNTVLVNGRSQIRRWMDAPAGDHEAKGRFATWISNGACDYVCSSYTGGYGVFGFTRPKKSQIIEDVKHTRHILFVKPDYWLLVDEIEAVNPYAYEMLFHAPPGVSVEAQANRHITLNGSDDGPGLHIIPVEPDRVEVTWVAGVEDPIQGWYSVDHLVKAPSNAVCYRFNGRRLALLTLLIPYPAGMKQVPLSVENLAVQGGEGKALQVALNGRIDYLLFSADGSEKRFDKFASSGRVCLVRTDRDGQVMNRFDIPAVCR